nr:MAG TPA: hypothetical protein [Caudoviricetes sp.]
MFTSFFIPLSTNHTWCFAHTLPTQKLTCGQNIDDNIIIN